MPEGICDSHTPVGQGLMKELWRLSLRLSFPPKRRWIWLYFGESGFFIFHPFIVLVFGKNGAGSKLQVVLLMVLYTTKLFLLSHNLQNEAAKQIQPWGLHFWERSDFKQGDLFYPTTINPLNVVAWVCSHQPGETWGKPWLRLVELGPSFLPLHQFFHQGLAFLHPQALFQLLTLPSDVQGEIKPERTQYLSQAVCGDPALGLSLYFLCMVV